MQVLALLLRHVQAVAEMPPQVFDAVGLAQHIERLVAGPAARPGAEPRLQLAATTLATSGVISLKVALAWQWAPIWAAAR